MQDGKLPQSFLSFEEHACLTAILHPELGLGSYKMIAESLWPQDQGKHDPTVLRSRVKRRLQQALAGIGQRWGKDHDPLISHLKGRFASPSDLRQVVKEWKGGVREGKPLEEIDLLQVPSKVALPRTCTRCSGFMRAERDRYGQYATCLTCGYLVDAVVIVPIEDETLTGKLAQKPSHAGDYL